MVIEPLAFLGVCLLVICTPGPDTALTIRNSIIGGRRGGLLTAAGIATGQMAWTLAASVGIAGLLQASQPAFTALKIIGGAYLVVLGIQSILAAVRDRPSHEQRRVRSDLGRWSASRQGLLSNLANPKMAAFFLSLLPQFVSPSAGSSFVPFALLGLLFCLMTFGWLSIYTLAIHRLGSFLQKSRVRRALEAVTGTVLVGLGVRLAVDTRG
jgi:threonine/homoserine/homoserine lactone efflux protein